MASKAKALERKAEQESIRQQKKAEEDERKEAESWAVGAKDGSKGKAAEEKDAEKRRKAAEKAALMAAEQEELGSIVSKVSKSKKKGKDDFDMLNAALAQQPKTKAQKEAEQKKKDAEERKRREEEARIEKEERRKAEEELRKKALAKGIVVDHMDDLMVPINNTLPDEDDDQLHASGLDAAVGVMSMAVGGAKKDDQHPERRLKAMYQSFYERNLPQMKEDYPNLKLSQYKERIFEQWKSSPENPINQQQG